MDTAGVVTVKMQVALLPAPSMAVIVHGPCASFGMGNANPKLPELSVLAIPSSILFIVTLTGEAAANDFPDTTAVVPTGP